MRNPNPEYLIPLSPIHYQIMLALVEEPCHGYGLRDKVRLDSSGIMELSTSTIYLALKSMQRMTFIEAAGNEPGAGSPHARIKYRLSTAGELIVQQETDRLRDVVALAAKRLEV